jgi:multiple sugar transport system substrate-binding protein
MSENTPEQTSSRQSRKSFLVKAGVAAMAAGATIDTQRAIAAPALLHSDASDVTLQFWQLGNLTPEQNKYWQNLATQYSQIRPGVKVQISFIPNYGFAGSNKLTASFAAGVGPDVFVMSPGSLLQYVNNGILAPLDKYLTPADIADFAPNVLKAMKVNGKIYVLKYEMEPLALFYNKKLLDQKGIKPPTTWDEMLAAAKELKTPRMAGLAIETIPDIYQNFTFYPWIWQGGGDVVNSAWTKAAIDGPAGVAALKLFGDIVKNKLCPSKFIVRTFDITILAKGFAAMQQCGMWAPASLAQLYPSFEYGVTQLPHPAGGHPQSIFGGWGVVANSHSKNLDEASRFAAWLGAGTDAGAAKRGSDWVSVVKTDLSPRKSATARQVQSGFFKNPTFDFFLKQVYPTALAEPRFTPELIQAVSKAVQAVQFGGASPQSAASSAAKEINAYLKTYKGAH